jgi:hypothetical protein
MNKTIKLILVFAVIAAVGYGVWWAYTNMGTEQPEEEQQEEVIELTDDTTESIDSALEGIDIGDIDTEFGEIDELVDQL